MQDPEIIRRPAILGLLKRRTVELGFDMACQDEVGALLRVLAASKLGGRFLELGTGTGVGTAWILDGMDATASLVSVDVETRFQSVAREELGADSRVEFVLEDGIAFLKRQAPVVFDLVFADAMPGKFDDLDAALAVVKPGGVYVVDDLLPQTNWPDGHDSRVEELVVRLTAHKDFKLVGLDWASGMVVAVRQ